MPDPMPDRTREPLGGRPPERTRADPDGATGADVSGIAPVAAAERERILDASGRRQNARVSILAIADTISPFVYSANFPGNLPPFDIVLSAGDMPGHVLEFLATKLTVRPVYVLGNHHNAYLRDQETGDLELPGGCLNAHGRVLEHRGVLIAGIEGSPRYRPGPHQYAEWQMELIAARMTPRLLANRLRHGRAVDVLLTHAAPEGPHEGEDYPHRGVPAFNRFHRLWRPSVHVHGHVHLSGANAPREYVTDEGVRVVNAFGFTIIEVELAGSAVTA